MSFNAIFETLASNTSRNFKIDFLKSYSDNNTLKKIVFLALDPFTNFYIRKIPEYTHAKENVADSLDSVIDSLYVLSERKVTGNAAIEFLTKLLSSLIEEDSKVLVRIIGKDLKCGVSVSTANSVWKNLIKEYPCMLCSGYDDRLIRNITFPAFAQLKMDGMRINVIVKNGSVEFRTRNGKQLDLLGNLEEEFLAVSNEKNLVFDGELILKKDEVIMDRKTGNGILMKAQRGTLSEFEASMINIALWDVIPYEDFVEEKCNISYVDRFKTLADFNFQDKISVVKSKIVNSIEEANAIFEYYLSKGQEGIILKDYKGIWENKRTKTQIKFKGELECDLQIVDVQFGTVGSKYDGLLGALICESNDKIVKVNVGSGFTDDQRKCLTKEDLIGKIVSVKYNSRILNKSGEHSLFLPIFIEIRQDKEYADDSFIIK